MDMNDIYVNRKVVGLHTLQAMPPGQAGSQSWAMGRTREQKHMLMLYLLMAMCFLMWIALLSLTVVNNRKMTGELKRINAALSQRINREEAGYKPTGCACGMGCGSWDIRTDSTCHCQCAGIDWTATRCGKIGLE
ncbi:unnamed protein product [Caretta caretta]